MDDEYEGDGADIAEDTFSPEGTEVSPLTTEKTPLETATEKRAQELKTAQGRLQFRLSLEERVSALERVAVLNPYREAGDEE